MTLVVTSRDLIARVRAGTVDDAPDPGSGSNIPGGITAIGGQLWMAGMDGNGGSELPLIEHHCSGGCR